MYFVQNVVKPVGYLLKKGRKTVFFIYLVRAWRGGIRFLVALGRLSYRFIGDDTTVSSR